MVFQASLRLLVALLASHATHALHDPKSTADGVAGVLTAHDPTSASFSPAPTLAQAAKTGPRSVLKARETSLAIDQSTPHPSPTLSSTHQISSRDIIQLTISPNQIISIVGIGYSTDPAGMDLTNPTHSTTRHSTRHVSTHKSSKTSEACEAPVDHDYACFESGGCTSTARCGGIPHGNTATLGRTTRSSSLASSPSLLAETHGQGRNGASRYVNYVGSLILFAKKIFAHDTTALGVSSTERPTQAKNKPETAHTAPSSPLDARNDVEKSTTSLGPCPTEKLTFTIPSEGSLAVIFDCIPQTNDAPAANPFSPPTTAGVTPDSHASSSSALGSGRGTSSTPFSGYVTATEPAAGGWSSATLFETNQAGASIPAGSGTSKHGRTTSKTRRGPVSGPAAIGEVSVVGMLTAAAAPPPTATTIVLNTASGFDTVAGLARFVGALISGLLWA